jgi:hypothetical protein
MRVVFVFFLTLLFASCAHMEKIDENYTSKDPFFQKSYTHSPGQCKTASIKALEDLGSGVDEEKGNEIISRKWTALEGATAVGGGGYAEANYYKQQARIYVRINGEAKGCQVRVTKLRAWNNNIEYPKVNLAFSKQAVVEPFFKYLDERLN